MYLSFVGLCQTWQRVVEPQRAGVRGGSKFRPLAFGIDNISRRACAH